MKNTEHAIVCPTHLVLNLIFLMMESHITSIRYGLNVNTLSLKLYVSLCPYLKCGVLYLKVMVFFIQISTVLINSTFRKFGSKYYYIDQNSDIEHRMFLLLLPKIL
jgi:fatty-acid desaturase